MVQRRAARFVLSNYDQLASVTQMLNSTMKQRRENLLVIMLFEIINELVEVSTSDLLHPLKVDTRGHSLRYRQLNTTIDCYVSALFFPVAIKICTRLPC